MQPGGKLLFTAICGGVDKGVKAGAVVAVDQVAKFMDNHKIHQIHREFHKVHVEVEVADCGAAAPVGLVVLDSHAIVSERVFFYDSQPVTDDHLASEQFIKRPGSCRQNLMRAFAKCL